MDRRIDAMGALAFAAVGVAVLVLALTYPESTVEFDAIGPMGFPIVLGVGITVGGLLQAARSFVGLRRSGPTAPAEGTEDELEHPSSTRRALGFIVGSLLYLLALDQLGFFVATVPALVLALWAMQYRRPVPLVATSVGFCLLAFGVFYGVLSVPLPSGPVERALVTVATGIL